MVKQFLLITLVPQDPSRKTSTWHVTTTSGSITLGAIAWHSPWRRYCFFPAGGTLFDATCLDQIKSFLAKEMEKRKCSTQKK